MNETNMTRRQLVKAAGAVGAVYVLGPVTARANDTAAAASLLDAGSGAKLTPELTQGPYWVNTMLRRSDVRANAHGGGVQSGVPLDLYINVLDARNGSKPLDSLAVDIWHANALGLYSDESSQAAGGGTTSGGDTILDNWLRGYQITGEDRGLSTAPVAGQVSFKTIWPGWYSGRTIHIHVRVRKLESGGATIAGFTTQIFFSDDDNNRVLTGAPPYNTRSPQKDPTTDENDTVLAKADFATNIVGVKGSLTGGYRATFDIVLDSSEADAAGSLARQNGAGGPPGAGA